MLARRIIPCLDVAGGRVVKGVHFEALRDAGDPVEQAARYDAEGADELVFLDISASPDDRRTTLDMVARVAESIFIPFTVGGGIRSVPDAGSALRSGADKVSVNTAAVRSPELVSSLADSFGSQCVVAAVDVRRSNGRFAVVVNGGREETPLEALGWIGRLEQLGAGEILLTSMDRDGTGTGYDLDLLRAAAEVTGLPIIASGGAGELAHLAEALEAGAHGVLAATIFHYQGSSLPEARAFLRARGYPGPPMIARLFLLLAATAADAPCLRPTRAGTQVQGEVRVCPGRYRIADPSERGVIIVAASGTRLDLTGVVLESGDSVPGRFVGIGVASRNVDGVAVVGGTVRGYRVGIRLEGGRGHRVIGSALSGSRAIRSPSRATAWSGWTRCISRHSRRTAPV